MKLGLFNVAVFAGLTLWTAVARPWVGPGFAALAGARALSLVFWMRLPLGRDPTGPILGFLGLSYLGLAYLVAVLVGTPETARFWLVFSSALAILSPVVLLAWRLVFCRSTPRPGAPG